ncbi:tripartite tricarboxylate transporter substrate binding protein [Achromobacter animicus]|uniref:Bug family tripartite tricarboxylate transporter substrate binding protein n=1 Tax=Achromobacter animicus TaxID=1389935 RepID=UPI0028A91A30|nr:tripartite tricarboxylate transporter substrate binding protein [Achromobacter animicus]
MKATNLLKGLLCAIAAVAAAPSYAQTSYPDKPVHLIVPQPPGGTSDTLARMWAEHVGNQLGQSVIVENKPGANGSIAASYVARQPADGYSVFLAGVSNLALNPFIYKQQSYSPKDFEGVGLLVETPFILVASKASGIKSFDDLIARAKAEPGRLNFSSAGQGNATHLVVEMLTKKLGIQLMHVPFNGSVPALQSVIGGQTELMADVIMTGGAQAKAGKVTPLAILGTQHSAAFPDLPTLEDKGLKDFPYPNWYALVVPKGTPAPVIQKLNAATVAFLNDPAVVTKLQGLGVAPKPSGVDDVKRYTERDAALWEPLIKSLNISN